VIASGGPRFQFAGQEVDDASEHFGPLFGGSPPRIHIAVGGWSDVGTIVLGQEGSGKERWQMGSNPKPGQPEQDLPTEIVSRKAGWYFLRFYDSQDELIDSLDFRFIAGLRGITIHQNSPFPPSTEHVPATVEFLHDGDCWVQAASPSSENLTLERSGEKAVLTVPPSAECDRTHWLVGPRCGPQWRSRF
jgi:hypothetical protein